jgi:hypothetical protein
VIRKTSIAQKTCPSVRPSRRTNTGGISGKPVFMVRSCLVDIEPELPAVQPRLDQAGEFVQFDPMSDRRQPAFGLAAWRGGHFSSRCSTFRLRRASLSSNR